MKDRTIQTVVANISLVMIIVVSIVHQPETNVLGAAVGALLAINGYEAVARQADNAIK